MEVKELILMNSLRLFNLYGTEKVSTNHIAKESNISTGSLYYHFKNKEEIIRNLFVQMEDEYQEKHYKKINFASNINLEDIFFDDEDILNRFSFFMQETTILMKNDTVISKMFDEFFKKREGHIYMFIKFLQNQGYIIEQIKEDTIKKIANIICFESNYTVFLELGEEEPLEYKKAKKIIPLYGILTDSGKKILNLTKF